MTSTFLLLFMFAQNPVQAKAPDLEIMSLNDEMELFLADAVGDSKNPAQRLALLVYAVFNEKFLNLQYDNSRTRTAIETFQTRNGNCLSFTMMFVAMARRLGLDARFQEVENTPTWNKRGGLVVLSRHINAVVILPGRIAEVDFNPYAERKEYVKRQVPDQRAMAQFYNNLGAELFSERKFQESVPYFEKAVSTDSKLSFGWSNLGVAYKNTRQYKKAERAYLRALEIDRREFTAMANLATLYRDLGRIGESNRYFGKVERFRRKNPYYHFNLGERAFIEGRYGDAADHYKDAIRRKDKEHEFHYALAKSFAKLGDIKRAGQSLEKARKHSPDLFNENRYSQKLEKLAAGR